MKNYIQVDLEIQSQEQSDILIAELSSIDYEAFEENEQLLSAFIKEELYDEEKFKDIISAFNITYSKKIIAPENWNQKWEQDFLPVVVDDFAAVRASFHKAITSVQHEIIITPKMSFGTGHHATTYLMLQKMKDIEFRNKSVLDFGTGTGVLAILAKKLGANNVTAIDNDDWSIENAKENLISNDCIGIDLLKKDNLSGLGKFDVILANINLSVITSNADKLSALSHSSTKILLSGFLKSDEDQVTRVFSARQFKINDIAEKEGWICMCIQRY